MKKETLKRYAISSGLSFITGFLLAVIPMLDTMSLDKVDTAVYIGILVAGLRFGVKMMFENILLYVSEHNKTK